MLMRRNWGFVDLFEEMARLSQELGRDAAPRERAGGVFPALNLYDDGEAFRLRAELPGIEPSDLSLNATAQTVSIKGERKTPQLPEGQSWHRREREFGAFSRSLDLPQPINPDKIVATYKNGVLDVVLPKAEDARPRRVEISG